MAGQLGLDTLDTTMALLYDAVVTFSLALTRLQAVQLLSQTRLDCSGQVSWSWGNSLTNYMKVSTSSPSNPSSSGSSGEQRLYSAAVSSAA